MDIKILVNYAQELKKLRNQLENPIFDLHEICESDEDQRDRAGLSKKEKEINLDMIEDAADDLKLGLEYLNEGISKLDMCYRRSIRFIEPPNKKRGDK